MQFSAQFSTLSISVLAALATIAVGNPVADESAFDKRGSEATTGNSSVRRDASYVISDDEMKRWIATTDANLTFIGTPFGESSTDSSQTTVVTYCNKRSANVCGGDCTVYSGAQKCLDAHDTQCLAATRNVAFCGSKGCGGICNNLDNCGTRLDDGFCYTPGTKSINVPSA